MSSSHLPPFSAHTDDFGWNQRDRATLFQGDVLVQATPYSAWGCAVTAVMYLPLTRVLAWQKLTDYSRWVQYFPDITHSEVLHPREAQAYRQASSSFGDLEYKYLYQAATKALLCLNVKVEVYLRVMEILHQRIQFQLEKGSFTDFVADVTLQDYAAGTLLTYAAQATPNIPVPAIFIQHTLNFELPTNMRKMRQVLCLP